MGITFLLILSYRRNKEGDPAHHDKHCRREIDGEDERPQRPRQPDLKAVDAVVTWQHIRVIIEKNVASLTGGAGKNGPVLGKFDNIHVEGKCPLILFEIRKFSIQLHMKRIIANWK